jgi:hypothetical protein
VLLTRCCHFCEFRNKTTEMLGACEIQGPMGSGCVGEVYEGRDGGTVIAVRVWDAITRRSHHGQAAGVYSSDITAVARA